MSIKQMTRISLFTAMIIVFTLIVPKNTTVFNIPITLQTLVVMFAAVFLKPMDAFISMLLYLIIGAIGLPVFANFSGGIPAFAGASGGFLLSFPIVAFLISLFKGNKSFVRLTVVNILFGVILLYLIGSLYIAILFQTPFFAVLFGMALFIPLDLVKVLIASYVGIKLRDIKYLEEK